MAECIDVTTEEEIDAALERARYSPDLPRALSARYDFPLDAIVITLEGGRRLLLPRIELQGLEAATGEQLSQIEIHAGVGIAWPQLDVDHYLPYLLAGQYGSNRWMKALERLGIADTANNSGHAVAKLKAFYALYPLTGPFSYVEGQELLSVRAIYRDKLFCGLSFGFASGSFVVKAVSSNDTIDVEYHPQDQAGVDVSGDHPWSTLVGTEVGWSWLALNQRGYLDSVLLSFSRVVVPEVAITAVASELKVRQLLAIGDSVSSTATN